MSKIDREALIVSVAFVLIFLTIIYLTFMLAGPGTWFYDATLGCK